METKARLALAPVPANQKLSLLGELGNLVVPVSNSRYTPSSVAVTFHPSRRVKLHCNTPDLSYSVFESFFTLELA